MQVDLVNMLKFRAFNAMDAFISAALAVLVPLALASRGVSIVSIGWVVALTPLVFTISRTLFASLADGIGTKPFFMLNAATNAAAAFLYMNATSASAYVSGRFLEGVRGGSIWAVNRLEALELSAERRIEKEFARLAGMRSFCFALGTIGAGFIAERIGFEGAFLGMAILGAAAFLLSLTVGSGGLHVEALHLILARLDVRKKSAKMWRSAACMVPAMSATTLPLSFLLPLYLNSKGFGYEQIGVAIALYYLTDASATQFAMRVKEMRDNAAYAALLFCSGVAVLVATDMPYIGVVLLAMGDGFCAVVWEAVIVHGSRGSKNSATDIGIMHIPAHFVTAGLLVAAGVIVSMFGFAAAFMLSGALMLTYCIMVRIELD
ncbi:Major Facilitator Superfamily protein [Candidatus Anstonella stagnisolia]|nr:Major Facilitator Superfamily protein [Candidatus Anstonella stagnisolia]